MNSHWLTKRSIRKTKGLKLWKENPRLDPQNTYHYLKDFAEEIILSDKDNFISLAKSIAKTGFIPADPIIVWKDSSDNRYYVAEGNRRVLALKFLLEPQRAPKSIRKTFISLSKQTNKTQIDKIPVCVAPSLDEAEWYIFQRHNQKSLQKSWTREQQLRALWNLYDKYEGDIEIIKSKTQQTEKELESHIRTLKLKDKVKLIENSLSKEEYTLATSHNFPISTLERWFNSVLVRDAWKIEYEGININFKNESGFLNAFSELIKRMLLPIGDPKRIDSRTIKNTEDIEKVLKELPSVDNVDDSKSDKSEESEENDGANNEPQPEPQPQPEPDPPKKPKKNDPNRRRLILGIYHLETDTYRLYSIFEELKIVPLKYKNSVAGSIRIFLDLSILNYILSEDVSTNICRKFSTSLRNITLKQRLEFFKDYDNLTDSSKKIIKKLLNMSNDFSLDVLNGYVHSQEAHFIDEKFLNKFWDFLFPLFLNILDIKETN